MRTSRCCQLLKPPCDYSTSPPGTAPGNGPMTSTHRLVPSSSFSFHLSGWTLNLFVHVEPSSAKSCKSPSDMKLLSCYPLGAWSPSSHDHLYDVPEVSYFPSPIWVAMKAIWTTGAGSVDSRHKKHYSHYSGGVCYSKAYDIRPCELSSNSREERMRYSDNQGSITQESKLWMQLVNLDV